MLTLALLVTLGLSFAATPVASAVTAQAFDPADCEDVQPSDPSPYDNWATDRLQLAKVHRLATGSGQRIAIIDTGVDPANLSFRSGQVTTVTIADNETQKAAKCQHGTGVASLIGSQPGRDDRTTFVGVAPGADILAIRTLRSGPTTNGAAPDPDEERQALVDTIAAVDYAVEQKVDIISISQQGADLPAYRAAIGRAVEAGILVVAAAGNFGNSSDNIYPAAYPGVMAVGMTTRTDLAAPQSQYSPGLSVSVAAPGFDVMMLAPSGKGGRAYVRDSGTSFAVPLVSGTAALVMQRYPKMTAQQVKRRLEITADAPAVAVPDPQLGWGIVDPFRALTDPMVDEPSTAATPAPQTGETPRSPYDRQPADHGQRNLAIAIAAGAMAVVLVGGVVAASLPAGRRRRWRPGGHD